MRDSGKTLALLAAALLLAGCGDKVPQSEAAKKVGAIPKQTVDRAAERTNEALRKGAERSAQEEPRQEKK
jgi:ABC-type sugar transport system substrate-binding protein